MKNKMIRRIKNQEPRKLLLIIGGVVILGYILFSLLNNNTSANSQVSNTNVKLAKPLSQVAVGRTFEYPIRDKEGNEVSMLKISVENASLEKEIVVKGKRNKAVEGRMFLVLNLKIQNQFDKSIDIKSRDYFRLIVNGNQEEKLAPEIHNDPIKVQAISTKLTRVGFILYESDTNPVLQVGEINGYKETIELDLKSR